MSKPERLHPLGKQKLKLIKFIPKDSRKITFIFKGLDENDNFIILRTFRYKSKNWKFFANQFEIELTGPDFSYKKIELENKIFEVVLTKANNPNYVNIKEFLGLAS